MDKLKLESVGDLVPDKEYKEILYSQPIKVPFFEGKKVVFEIDGSNANSLERIDKAIGNFLEKNISDRSKITKYIIEDYRDFIRSAGFYEDTPIIIREEDVWRYVFPNRIYVGMENSYRGSSTVYLRITSGCGWEIEHGLDIVYQEGKEFVGFGIIGTNIVDIKKKAKRLGII